MANDSKNGVLRSLARVFRFMRVGSSSERPDVGEVSPADKVNYGAFTNDELRHMDGMSPKVTGSKFANKPVPEEGTIANYLEQISDNTHSKIEEIKNLTCVAPEMKVAARVIVSTIMSPTELQTNKLNITMNYAGITADVKNQILKYLNTFFNEELNLPKKLAAWLKTAGFTEGAKAIMVLPKHELDVQNAISDKIYANTQISGSVETLKVQLKESAKRIHAGEESLLFDLPDAKKAPSLRVLDSRFTDADYADNELLNAHLDVELDAALESLGVEKFFADGKHNYVDEGTEGKKELTISDKKSLAAALKAGTFKLLRHNGDGTVVVTKDLNPIKKGATHNRDIIESLMKDAKAQLTGFDPTNPTAGVTNGLRCYTISDNIKLADNDLPIIVELPSDAVIPVCAPRDKENHIGYFVMLDEQGNPITGKTNYFKTGSTDVSNRLAINAARGVYGNATLSSFQELANSPEMVLRQMTDVFAVAVNKLLESKLRREGLTGLTVNVHNAVGKALFMNLLAKNRVKMIFVPEPMMVYYRFDHRDDGTGKTLIEDAGQMLAMRTTFVVARLMAAIDNATQHRKIEVDVDEKDNNQVQTLQMVLRQALSKYAPSFSTEVQTAAESLVNRNISVVPKSVAGTTDNLSVTVDKTYGNSQPPDQDLMDKLNNWIGMELGGLPPAVLNQLSENEFSRSVATTNMYFANQIFEWQNTIKSHNKKFIVLYTSTNARLVNKIREILGKDKKGEPDKIKENKSNDVKDVKLDDQVRMIIESLDVDLPKPVMAAKKAHFEEITAFTEMITKVVSDIFSDDIVVDDELKGNMQTIRAAIVSMLLREFLPQLGCQAIAAIPEPSAINADYATETTAFLMNLRRRIKNLSDAIKGQLPANANAATGGAGEENPENPDQQGEEGTGDQNNPPTYG